MNINIRVLAAFVFLLVPNLFSWTNTQQNQTISDSDIKILDFQDLEYPSRAKMAHVQGVVVVRATLDDQGRVVEATAISGNALLIPDCLANVSEWHFRKNAENAAIIVYDFRLTDGISKSGCSHFLLRPPNFATITGCVQEIQ